MNQFSYFKPLLTLLLFGAAAFGLQAQCGYTVATGSGGFVDISTTGTPLGLTDDGEGNIVMPFDFNFFGTASTAPIDLRVGNNGGILYGTDAGNLFAGNSSLPATSFTSAILPFWDDLDTESGDVYWEVQGTAPAQVLIVQWEDRPHFNGATNPGSATFQAQLYEGSSAIIFAYEDVIFDNPTWDNGASATVGIQGNSTDVEEFSFNSAVIMNNMSITYTPNPSTGDPTQAVCQPAMLTLDPITLEATLDPADVDGGSTVACGTPMLSVSQTTFTAADLPSATVTLTVTDATGATSTCLAVVGVMSVADITPPMAVCQDITIALDENGMAAIMASDVDGGSTDDTGITSTTVDIDAFDCLSLGAQAVTLTVADAEGNEATCTATVTVEDQDGPTIVPFTMPTVALDATSGMVMVDISSVDSASVDNCGIASIALTDAAGGIPMFDCMTTGVQTLTLTAIDNNGLTSVAMVDVMVADETGPTIFCNEKQWEEAEGDCEAYVILIEPTILADNCPTELEDYVVTNDGPTDQIFPVGVTILTWTVTDPNGNSTTCEQEIEVLDLLPAEIYCGGTVFGYAQQGQCFANVPISVPISNVCQGVTVTGTGTFPFPITGGQQIITATKPNGQVAVCTLNVAVIRQVGDNSNDNCLGPPDGNAADNIFMRSVGIETYINKTGDNGGYSAFYDKPVEVEGNLSEVALKLEAMGLPNNQEYFYYVWADFDCDGIFNNGSEFWYEASSADPINTTLAIPEGSCGQVRVRVRVTSAPFDFAYGEAPSGEVEDYLMLVPQAPDAQGTDVLGKGDLGDFGYAEANDLTLRPNPATSEVFVNFDGIEREAVNLTIVNTLGQEMMRRTYDQFPVEGIRLDVADYDTGIYFVTTRRGDQQRTERLVVRRN